MSRENEIRERLESADPKDWRHHDFGFPGDEEPTSIAIHEGKFDWRAISEGEFIAMLDADGPDDRNARLIANAPADLAYLLAENARLRAQLDTVRELAGDAREHLFEGVFELASKYDIDVTNSPDMRPGVAEVGDLCGDVLDLFREAVRAALNQGGETNGD